MKSIFLIVCMITLGAVLMLGWALPLSAQETKSEEFTLEEITVTAERHKSDLQALASSVSVQNGDDLVQQGRSSIFQALEDVPSVALQMNNLYSLGQDNQGSAIVIRGALPNASTLSNSPIPSTAVYTDAVYEGIGNSYDVSRIEILRGPQGTLYGRSATGGVVAIHTNDPALGSYQGNVSADIGNYGKQDIQAALNIPATDSFAIRVAGHLYKRDGYFAEEGEGNAKTTEGRIKMLYKPNEDFSILLGASLQYSRMKSGGYIFSMDGPDKYSLTQYDIIGTSRNHSQQFWAQIDWNIGIGTLTYQPAFRKFYLDSTGRQVLSPIMYVELENNRPKDNYWTHELRLASNPGSPITWQTGVFYYENEYSMFNSTGIFFMPGFPAPSPGFRESEDITKETKNIGVFSEATFPINDTLRVTAGLRYDYTDIATEELMILNSDKGYYIPSNLSGDAGKRSFNNWTYKLRIEKDLTSHSLLYGSISTGFLPGDVTINKAGTAETGFYPDPSEFATETLTAFEIGAKNRFLDNKLQVNGAVFYYDYGGYQKLQNIGTMENPNFIMLSEAAIMRGGEIETLFQITKRDRLSVALSYTYGKFTDPSDTFRAYVAQEYFTNIPPWLATLGYDHMFDLPGGSILNLHGDVNFRSGYDVSTATPENIKVGWLPYAQNDAVWIENLNATWTSSNGVFSITGYVRNLADIQYKTNSGISTAPSLSDVTSNLSDPRTYGVVLSVKF